MDLGLGIFVRDVIIAMKHEPRPFHWQSGVCFGFFMLLTSLALAHSGSLGHHVCRGTLMIWLVRKKINQLNQKKPNYGLHQLEGPSASFLVLTLCANNIRNHYTQVHGPDRRVPTEVVP